MDARDGQRMLEEVFAPWVRDLGLQAESLAEGVAVLRLPFDRKLTHVAGVVCGQVYMAAADTAMVLAVASILGEFKPMTTVSLNTSFLRPVSAGDVRVTARVLRRGKNLVFGEIALTDSEDKLVAHATTTYALL
ncbi:MAG: PaaI family thioesterase [Noviherbaspirillum sp.]